ncbi:hypothetical protein CCACVL1_12235 [Corchorus capsularis]|uniref:Uncharacterized protein n=1 Tax=Corchorus capsularis TaxID=210143 RepID=A0A1R3IGP4_COCAP|nr:hypothetical protein CCACVL1_12235 [Corchorus capsularis]
MARFFIQQSHAKSERKRFSCIAVKSFFKLSQRKNQKGFLQRQKLLFHFHFQLKAQRSA